MRVLLSTYGSRGDVEPMIGLAAKLRGLGADVRVCAPRNTELAGRLTSIDVSLVPLGQPVPPMTAGGGAAAGSNSAAEYFLEQFGVAAAAAEGCDAVVVSGLHPAAVSARSVAEKRGIPYAYACYQPGILPSPQQESRSFPRRGTGTPEPRDRDGNVSKTFGPPLNAFRAAIGLPPLDNVRDYIFTDQPWLAADPTLAPRQKQALDVVQTGAWILPDERPLPAELAAFLDAGTPPVYVGFGSIRVPQHVARVAIEAVRAQGRRVILSRGWAGLALIDDRDDCFAVGEVNQQALFGRVAAVLHHGGAGTTTTAARAGAPQVVVPQRADQPYWAGRVAELGIGTAHDGQALTTGSLSDALRRALVPVIRARAAAVAGIIRTDGATVAARLLFDAVSRNGRRMPTG